MYNNKCKYYFVKKKKSKKDLSQASKSRYRSSYMEDYKIGS